MLFPFLKPDLPRPEEWTPLLNVAYEQRYFSNFGPLAVRLAKNMATTYLAPGYSGALCASNTAGLIAVLQALGVAGCKVAIPDFTFAATPQAVFAAGAVPVVCDIDADTWELCPNSLQKAFEVHPEIAAVIHVRPFGLVRDLSAVRTVCRQRNVPLLVDAAAGLGAPSSGHQFGSEAGEIEVFSLHATKVFAIGEGGFIAAPDHLMPAIKSAMNFGFNANRTYSEGQNAKLDEFRAAIGLAMLEKMNHIVLVREEHAVFYQELLSEFPECTLPMDPGPTPWSTFPVVFKQPVTAQMLGAFSDNGIEIKKYYWPGVMKGYTGEREIHAVDISVSLNVQDRCACFPVYSDFTADTSTLLAERIKRALSML